MADNPERITRREFLSRVGKASLLGGAMKMLHIQTAYAAQAIDCPLYMFHGENISVVDRVIRANAREGRTPVTVGKLTKMIMGEEEVPGSIFGITFDDGLRSQYTQISPLLNSYEVPATFFVTGTAWKGDGVHTYMKPEDMQVLYEEVMK